MALPVRLFTVRNRHIEAAEYLAPLIKGSKKTYEASLRLLADAKRAANEQLSLEDVSKYDKFINTLQNELEL